MKAMDINIGYVTTGVVTAVVCVVGFVVLFKRRLWLRSERAASIFEPTTPVRAGSPGIIDGPIEDDGVWKSTVKGLEKLRHDYVLREQDKIELVNKRLDFELECELEWQKTIDPSTVSTVVPAEPAPSSSNNSTGEEIDAVMKKEENLWQMEERTRDLVVHKSDCVKTLKKFKSPTMKLVDKRRNTMSAKELKDAMLLEKFEAEWKEKKESDLREVFQVDQLEERLSRRESARHKKHETRALREAEQYQREHGIVPQDEPVTDVKPDDVEQSTPEQEDLEHSQKPQEDLERSETQREDLEHSPAPQGDIEHSPPQNQEKSTETVAVAPDASSSMPKPSKRFMVIKELLATERSFLASLDTAKEVYYPVLVKMTSERDARAVFQTSEWDAIKMFSSVIISHVSDRLFDAEGTIVWDESKSTIGDVLLYLLPYYKVYTRYVNRFNDSRVLLRKLTSSSKDLANALDKCERDPRSRRLGLVSFLIMIVQRVPQTLTLVVELLKRTPESHPDYEHLNKLLSGLQDISTYINTQSHQSEGHMRLLTLVSGLTDVTKLSPLATPLVQPHRRVEYEFDATVGYGVVALSSSSSIDIQSLSTSELTGAIRAVQWHAIVMPDMLLFTVYSKKGWHRHNEDPTRRQSAKLDVMLSNVICVRARDKFGAPENRITDVMADATWKDSIAMWYTSVKPNSASLVLIKVTPKDREMIMNMCKDYPNIVV